MTTPDGRTFSAVRGAEQQLWRLTWTVPMPDPPRCMSGPSELRLGVASEDSPVVPDVRRRGSACACGPPVGLRGGHVVQCRALAPPPASDWSVDIRGQLTRRHPRIKELDAATRKVTTYAPTVDGGGALAWTPSDRLLMASGAKLFVRENKTDQWIENADLRKPG